MANWHTSYPRNVGPTRYKNEDLFGAATAGTFGNSTNVPQITIDANGNVVSVVNVPIAFPGAAITTQEEGVSLSTTVNTINFVGTGVTASGAGATTTVTVPGPTPGTSPARSVSLQLAPVSMVATPGIFSGGGAGVLGSLVNDTASVTLMGNWYGTGAMASAAISGFVTMQFFFNVEWTVASNPTWTIDIDMGALWVAMGMPLAWSGALNTSFPRGLMGVARNNINVKDIVDVSYPLAGTIRFVWNVGAASLSHEVVVDLLISVGGAI